MSWTKLEQQFVDDHRHLTQGFQSLIESVEKNDTARCRRDADELDRVAGPHIKFEELVLYPKVRQDRGNEMASRLLREHQVGRSAIAFLESHTGDSLSPVDRARVLEQLRVGLDHAVTCGTLLSHLTVVSKPEQTEMLNQLQEIKKQQTRWTELDGPLPAAMFQRSRSVPTPP